MAGAVEAVDWGAFGTVLIGLAGVAIAWLQYRNSIFIPTAEAVTAKATEKLPGRKKVLVRVTNRGGAPGMVDAIYAVDAAHEPLEQASFTWIGWNDRPPVPFTLPGKSVAVVAIEFSRSLPDHAGIKVQVEGHRSVCGGLTEVDLAPTMRTALPPNSLGIIAPPLRP